MNKSRSFVVGIAAAACTLAACGSSSTVASSVSKAAGATTASGVTTASGGTTAAGGATATTKAAATGGGSLTKFCALSQQFETKYGSGGAFDNLSSDSPADIKKFFTSFDADIKTWEAAAPADIKPTIVSQTALLASFDTILKKYDYDFTKAAADPAFLALASTDNSAAAGAASDDEKLTAYMKDKCGIDPDADDSSSTTTG